MVQRKPDETDAQFLTRLAENVPTNRAVVLTVTTDGSAGDRTLVSIRVKPNGVVTADRIGGKRLVLRLTPPPTDESIYGLIERVARRCREVDESGR